MNSEQLNLHLQTAKLLDMIKDQIFLEIKNNPKHTEFTLQEFIFQQYERNNLITGHKSQIVAFDEHSSSPHYFPRKKSSKTIKPETIILIDMWARLKFRGTPYADITWVGYYGQSSPKKIEEQFNCLLKIRDDVLLCIEKRISDLPTGKEIDDFTRNLLSVKGFNKNILHSTGHSISPKNCHGHKPHLNQRNNEKILVNQLYTIEPGIYFSDYGLRTEIDFYINKDYRLIITTPKQTELVLIQP